MKDITTKKDVKILVEKK